MIFYTENVIKTKKKLNEVTYDNKYDDLKTCNKEFKIYTENEQMKIINMLQLWISRKMAINYHIIRNLTI